MKGIIRKIKRRLAEIQNTDEDFIEHVNLLFAEQRWIYGTAIDSEHEEEIWFKMSSDGKVIEKSYI